MLKIYVNIYFLGFAPKSRYTGIRKIQNKETAMSELVSQNSYFKY